MSDVEIFVDPQLTFETCQEIQFLFTKPLIFCSVLKAGVMSYILCVSVSAGGVNLLNVDVISVSRI